MSTHTENADAKVTVYPDATEAHVASAPENEEGSEERAAASEVVSEEAAMDISDELQALQAEIERLNESNTALKDEALRAQAESQNARRRADKEIDNARKFALEGFVRELVPMLDSLESGLEKIPEDDATQAIAREGLGLTLKQGLEALRKYHVEQVYPLGQPFDPALHQAMAMQESPDCEPNTVLHVMQKGYTLSGRLVRPAMVVVSKAAATQKIDENI